MSPEAHGNFSGKHLVVFGAGYVGGEVARQAQARGLQVTALTRNAEKAAGLRTAGIETVVADLAGDAWHGMIPARADYVLNAVSSGGGGVESYRRSYLEGMRSVLAWMRAQDSPGTLVYTSSTSVYPQDGGIRVDESSPISGRNERAAVLVETEALLHSQILKDGSPSLRAFILRLAGIYGPGRQHLVEQVRAGEVSGHAGHHLNLIHRDDICAAIWAAFSAPVTVADTIFNVADDAPATKAEVVAWLATRLGVPVPRFTGNPAGGRRAVTPDRIIVNRRLKATLNWTPCFPSFREGYASFAANSSS